jgi:hypothetical protein
MTMPAQDKTWWVGNLSLDTLVERLRAEGWRVRCGKWPTTKAAQANWDFWRSDEQSLHCMTPQADEAVQRIADELARETAHEAQLSGG